MANSGANNQQGFALIAVLFSLAILTLLFVAAQKNLMSHTLVLNAEMERYKRQEIIYSVPAIALLGIGTEEPADIIVGGDIYKITVQDVGGLVDVNTAHISLVEKLLSSATNGQTTEYMSRYSDWRGEGRSFHRAEDFQRAVGQDDDTYRRIAPFLTIHSGRTGISPDVAPMELLESLSDQSGSREYLASQLPPTFVSQPSKVNYRLRVREGEQTQVTAVVHVSQASTSLMVLLATNE